MRCGRIVNDKHTNCIWPYHRVWRRNWALRCSIVITQWSSINASKCSIRIYRPKRFRICCSNTRRKFGRMSSMWTERAICMTIRKNLHHIHLDRCSSNFRHLFINSDWCYIASKCDANQAYQKNDIEPVNDFNTFAFYIYISYLLHMTSYCY